MCSETKDQVMGLMGQTTRLLFQPASRAAAALSPNPRLMLETSSSTQHYIRQSHVLVTLVGYPAPLTLNSGLGSKILPHPRSSCQSLPQ